MAYMKQWVWLPEGDKEGLISIDAFTGFQAAECGRYHLYTSFGCPFAHRAILAHSLLELEGCIGISSVAPLKQDNGWVFNDSYSDPVLNKQSLHAIYRAGKADYTGKVSVPVLWDKQLNTVISNDSLAIARWLASQCRHLTGNSLELLPEQTTEQILSQCDRINARLNSAVFQAGFATEQSTYENAATAVFEFLDEIDTELAENRYFNGSQLTLSDLLLFPSLIQFDTIYYTHFKLNLKRIQDYEHLWAYLQDLMRVPQIRGTVHFDYLKQAYFSSQKDLNPSGIIPIGPEINWD